MLISFVIPCYRSEKTIELVINEIIETIDKRNGFDYEIICVNDCSPDGVLTVLKKLAETNRKIKVINFAKNMGKPSAVLAGYRYANGDFIVNTDDDYQCPIYDVWKLYDALNDGEYDVATAEYIVKKESFIKRVGSDINLWMTEVMLNKPRDLRFENFSMMKSFVAKEVIKYTNPYPYIEGLIFRVTHKVTKVKMEERDRGDSNSTGYTIAKSIALISNGLTTFSVKPLRLSSFLGFMFSIIGFISVIYTIIRKLLNPDIMMGYSSIMAVILFVSGLIMMMLGIIGEYLGRIYICINDSPQYVVKETYNINE